MSDATSYHERVANRPSLEVPDFAPVDLDDVPCERCDRCGGRAAHRVRLRTGYLFFCATDYERNAEALALVVAVPSAI